MAPIYIMIDQEGTGRNIQNLMLRRGLKVRDVQEACGFENPQAVYKWIHGQSLPSIDNLLVLAKLFGSTVEGILATSGDALPHSKGSISMDDNNFIQLDHFSLFNDAYMYAFSLEMVVATLDYSSSTASAYLHQFTLLRILDCRKEDVNMYQFLVNPKEHPEVFEDVA